jgi:hypothetical protein
MKKRPLHFALALVTALALATSCSRHADHDHDGHDHADHDHADHADHGHAHADHGHDHAGHDHAQPQKTDPAGHDDHDDHDHDKHTAPKTAADRHADAHKDDHDGHDHKPAASAGKHDEHSGHSHGESESANVTYNEKTGLTFDPATAAAINLTTARIATRPLAHRITLNATVINAGPPVQVTALVPPAIADDMEQHDHDGVRLLALNRALTHATAQVEITLALAGAGAAQAATPAHTPGIGDTLAVPLTGPAEQKLTIPNTAILRTVTGAYAYIHRGGSYQRTPVTLGATDGAHTEILAGLAANDEVAATAVEQLWLTELRLTKGGGHSH